MTELGGSGVVFGGYEKEKPMQQNGVESAYFHHWSCSSHKTYFSGNLPHFANTSAIRLLSEPAGPNFSAVSVSLGRRSWHKRTLYIKACQKSTRTEGAFRLVQAAPLPKGLISDRSVNSAGDCMVSPTTFLPTTTAPCGECLSMERGHERFARHPEWGDSRLRAWTGLCLEVLHPVN